MNSRMTRDVVTVVWLLIMVITFIVVMASVQLSTADGPFVFRFPCPEDIRCGGTGE